MWTVYTGEQYRAALDEWDRRKAAARESGRYLPLSCWYGTVAYAVADCVEAELNRRSGLLPVVVLAGAGGNGRAGLRAGAELLHRGYRVEVVLFPASGPDDDDAIGHHRHLGSAGLRAKWESDVGDDSREQLQAFLHAGGRVSPMTGQEEVWKDCVVVDAINGRGTDGPLWGPAAEWAEYFWAGRKVIAVDLPTGIDPETGDNCGSGFFPASTTVVIGGLRPAHLLRGECGRLVFVPGGLAGLLGPVEEDRQNAAATQDAEQYVETCVSHEPPSLRIRLGFLAGDPGGDAPLPDFTDYPDSEDRDGSPWCRQVLGTLDGDAYDRHLREAAGLPTLWDPRVESVVGLTGHPARRPGAAVTVADGALNSTARGIVCHRSAAAVVSRHYTQVEVVDGTGRGRTKGVSWVVCSGAPGVDPATVERLIVTRDAVLDWIEEGKKPPEFSGGPQVIVVVDRDTAVEALVEWSNATREVVETWNVIHHAERMATLLRCEVILSGSTTVYAGSTTTTIIRDVGSGPVQGYEELLAGAVAAAGAGKFSSTNSLIAMFVLPRAVSEVSRRAPAVALTAQKVADALPEALREWRSPRHRR